MNFDYYNYEYKERMEYQKIWVEVNDKSHGIYNTGD